MSDKYLDKIAALLRRAETTKNEHEAATFMAGAQRLATTHSISLEIARQHQTDKEKRETPVQRTIRLGEAGKKGLKYYCRLFMAIGGSNDLKFNIAHNSTYVIAFGLPSDIEMTELLYASLIVQMVESSNRYLRSGAHKEGWQAVDGRVARSNFMESYISRITYRLSMARLEAVEAAVSEEALVPASESNGTGTELVLANKALEVTNFYKETSQARGSWGGYSSSKGYSASARAAGTEAASKAALSARRAIGTGSRQINA